MLIILNVDLFDFLLEKLLLILFKQSSALRLEFSLLKSKLTLLGARRLYFLFESCYLLFSTSHGLFLHVFMLVLRYKELLAKEFKCQVLISHVTLVYILLNCDLPLKFDVHVDLHCLKLRVARATVMLGRGVITHAVP
jgi:hypothetical protein